MSIFINFTNHPSAAWQKKQTEAAEKYGEIKDIPFPSVPSKASEEEVSKMAKDYVERILLENLNAVLCQGEFTLAYQVIKLLKDKGIIVVAACSERKVTEENNRKIVEFQFEGFRKY